MQPYDVTKKRLKELEDVIADPYLMEQILQISHHMMVIMCEKDEKESDYAINKIHEAVNNTCMYLLKVPKESE